MKVTHARVREVGGKCFPPKGGGRGEVQSPTPQPLPRGYIVSPEQPTTEQDWKALWEQEHQRAFSAEVLAHTPQPQSATTHQQRIDAITTELIDAIATELMALVERHAPHDGDPNLASAGDLSLLAALARRVGPLGYARLLAELMPSSKA